MRIKPATELLDHMSNQAKHSAPKAKIATWLGTGGDWDLSKEDRGFLEDVLSEVDDKSD